jgi:hypothetical protein
MKPNTPIETACFRQVSISDARLLRDKVLRPGYAPGGSVYPGDDEPETLHIGAFMRNNAIAVATICHENMPGKSETGAWPFGSSTCQQDITCAGLNSPCYGAFWTNCWFGGRKLKS